MLGALLAAMTRATARRSGSRLAAALLLGVVLIIAVGRFSRFTVEAIDDRLRWFEDHRTYADEYRAQHPTLPATSTIVAPAPRQGDVRPEYIQPMLRWIYQRPDLIVTVEGAPPRQPQRP